MKFLFIFALVALAAARPGDDDSLYDSKYDNFDMDEVLGNARLMCAYAKCFAGTGNCTPEGKEFKKLIPDGATNSCKSCSDKQKVLIAKFMKGVQEKCPTEWELLNKEYDPKGEHKSEIKEFIETHSHE